MFNLRLTIEGLTFMQKFGSFKSWCYNPYILENLKHFLCNICLRHTLEDGKSQFWHAAANKCCGSGPCPSFQNCAWAQRKRNEKVPAIILCILYNTMSCILYNNILCCVCYTMHCFVFSLYTILFPKDSNILESYLYDCFRVTF